MSAINTNIKLMRQARKISCQELSRHTGISRSTLSEIENGKRQDISLTSALALSRFFSVTVEQLIDPDYVANYVAEAAIDAQVEALVNSFDANVIQRAVQHSNGTEVTA